MPVHPLVPGLLAAASLSALLLSAAQAAEPITTVLSPGGWSTDRSTPAARCC